MYTLLLKSTNMYMILKELNPNDLYLLSPINFKKKVYCFCLFVSKIFSKLLPRVQGIEWFVMNNYAINRQFNAYFMFTLFKQTTKLGMNYCANISKLICLEWMELKNLKLI